MRYAALALGSLMLASCVAINDTSVTHAAPETSRADAEQLVAARQAGMRMMVFTLSSVTRASENAEAPIDRAGFGIGGLAKFADSMPVLFGDATATIGGTKALPAVWDDPEGFAARINEFQSATDALAASAAANDREGFAEALASTTGACKACHDSYRVEDN